MFAKVVDFLLQRMGKTRAGTGHLQSSLAAGGSTTATDAYDEVRAVGLEPLCVSKVVHVEKSFDPWNVNAVGAPLPTPVRAETV